MNRITRRKFLGTAAGGAAVGAFPHVWRRPAWAQQTKEVRVLAWTHFVPSYDKWYDAFAEQWSTKNNVKVTIDHVPHLQIPAKIAAEIATQSGHDIVQLVGSGTEKWANALLDIQDSADRAGKKHGGWTPLAENYAKANGTFHSMPDFFIDFPGLYRKDLWTEVGMANGPDTWEDLRVGGAKLKAKGFPLGIGLAHHDDARASWRAIMWSFGGSEVAKDGKTIAYNSKEVRDALKFNKALYKDCMTPEVMAWDDASNNRFLASGRASWIHNPISAYRTIEKATPELADKIYVWKSPAGPARRLAGSSPNSYGIWRFARNKDTAIEFLRHYAGHWVEAFEASTGYNHPLFANIVPQPMPILSNDPSSHPPEKLQVLQTAAEWHATFGYPGPSGPASDEVVNNFIIVDMMAKAATDQATPEEAVAWAQKEIEPIYRKWAARA